MRISTHAPAGGATRCRGCSRQGSCHFYSRPCGRGDTPLNKANLLSDAFLLTPLREGRRKITEAKEVGDILFLLTPLREGRPGVRAGRAGGRNFYSRPCGRGDFLDAYSLSRGENFYSRPCGRGDTAAKILLGEEEYFYSRPCGRGDVIARGFLVHDNFISTHAPAGGATAGRCSCQPEASYFYSRPCGRGDGSEAARRERLHHFYSRPCGRGDRLPSYSSCTYAAFLLTPLREGRLRRGRRRTRQRPDFYSRPCGRGDNLPRYILSRSAISTHAPAGGAT